MEALQDATKKGKNYSRNNTGQRREKDLYETPYSMTHQLFEVEYFSRRDPVLEPAAGLGAIAEVLCREGFKDVTIKDISHGDDFLKYDGPKVPYIITNPPYSLNIEFIEKCKEVAEQKFALLLPTDYLHGIERYNRIFLDQKFPLKAFHVFIRRPMLGDPLREDGKYRTGMTTYAWYVWEKNHRGAPFLGWIDNQKHVLGAKTK